MGGHYCSVVDCHVSQRNKPVNVKLYRFPMQEDRRKQWLRALKRLRPDRTPWQPGQSARICSLHFQDNEKSDDPASPSYIPTIFPTHRIRISRAAPERFKRLQNRKKAQAQRLQRLREAKLKAELSRKAEEAEKTDSCDEDNELHRDTIFLERGVQTNKALYKDVVDHFEWLYESFPVSPNKSDAATQARITLQLNEMVSHDASDAAQAPKEQPQITTLFDSSDEEFQIMTGMPPNVFDFILNLLGSAIADSRGFSRRNKLASVFVKLKLNLSYGVIGPLFNVSRQLASRNFTQIVPTLSNSLSDFITWFDRDTIKEQMPSSFTGLYADSRAIIDTFEIKCERSKNSNNEAQTFSSSKSSFSVKFLIACAPSGEVMFISKAYGGPSTNTELTVTSEFVKHVKKDDIILANEGFSHFEAAISEVGGTLFNLPVKPNEEQLSSAENDNCACVVERCIERLNRFQILEFLPRNISQYVDDILIIIAGVSNLLPDHVGQNRCPQSNNEELEGEENEGDQLDLKTPMMDDIPLH